MNIDFQIAVPGFISGLIVGAAVAISKTVRALVILAAFLFILWAFYEQGEDGLIMLYHTLLYDRFIHNKMFFVPFAIGFLIAIFSIAETR